MHKSIFKNFWFNYSVLRRRFRSNQYQNAHQKIDHISEITNQKVLQNSDPWRIVINTAQQNVVLKM